MSICQNTYILDLINWGTKGLLKMHRMRRIGTEAGSPWWVLALRSTPWTQPSFYLIVCKVELRRRQWQPAPVLLPGKSHGRRSLVGCSPWGLEESDTTEWLHFSLFTFMSWRRKWQSTPVFFPGESQRWGSLLSMGSHRVGHDWNDLAAAAVAKWSLFWVLTEEWRWLLWILSFHPLWPRGAWPGKCAWLVRSVHSWCPGKIWSHSTFRAPFRVTIRSSWPLVTSIILP